MFLNDLYLFIPLKFCCLILYGFFSKDILCRYCVVKYLLVEHVFCNSYTSLVLVTACKCFTDESYGTKHLFVKNVAFSVTNAKVFYTSAVASFVPYVCHRLF